MERECYLTKHPEGHYINTEHVHHIHNYVHDTYVIMWPVVALLLVTILEQGFNLWIWYNSPFRKKQRNHGDPQSLSDSGSRWPAGVWKGAKKLRVFGRELRELAPPGVFSHILEEIKDFRWKWNLWFFFNIFSNIYLKVHLDRIVCYFSRWGFSMT